jgi:hypothetical protein
MSKNIDYTITHADDILGLPKNKYSTSITVQYTEKSTSKKIGTAKYTLNIRILDSKSNKDESIIKYKLYMDTPMLGTKIYKSIYKKYSKIVALANKTEDSDKHVVLHYILTMYQAIQFSILKSLLSKYNLVDKGQTTISNVQLLMYSKEELMLQILNNNIRLDYQYANLCRRAASQLKSIKKERSN